MAVIYWFDGVCFDARRIRSFLWGTKHVGCVKLVIYKSYTKMHGQQNIRTCGQEVFLETNDILLRVTENMSRVNLELGQCNKGRE